MARGSKRGFSVYPSSHSGRRVAHGGEQRRRLCRRQRRGRLMARAGSREGHKAARARAISGVRRSQQLGCSHRKGALLPAGGTGSPLGGGAEMVVDLLHNLRVGELAGRASTEVRASVRRRMRTSGPRVPVRLAPGRRGAHSRRPRIQAPGSSGRAGDLRRLRGTRTGRGGNHRFRLGQHRLAGVGGYVEEGSRRIFELRTEQGSLDADAARLEE